MGNVYPKAVFVTELMIAAMVPMSLLNVHVKSS